MIKVILGDKIEHQKVATYLKNADDHDLAEIGQALDELREARVDADYKMDLPCDKNRASSAYNDADDLMDKIQKFGVSKITAFFVERARKISGT